MTETLGEILHREPEFVAENNELFIVDITGPQCLPHPPSGHHAGRANGHVQALSNFVNCVLNDMHIAPYGATFEVGSRVQVIMESMKGWPETGKTINLT